MITYKRVVDYFETVPGEDCAVTKAAEFFKCEPATVYYWKTRRYIPKSRAFDLITQLPHVFAPSKGA